MHRRGLLESLVKYRQFWLQGPASLGDPDEGWELSTLKRLVEFIQAQPQCFERFLKEGHVTGSSLIADPDLDYVLLTHHKKLGKWLQLGGHADGDADVLRVARREAEEESGLKGFKLLPFADSTIPFDIDLHKIPAHKAEPEHFHYDVRYLFTIDPQLPLVISGESNELRWFSLSEARQITGEWSMLRQFHKLEQLKALQKSARSPLAADGTPLKVPFRADV